MVRKLLRNKHRKLISKRYRQAVLAIRAWRRTGKMPEYNDHLEHDPFIKPDIWDRIQGCMNKRR